MADPRKNANTDDVLDKVADCLWIFSWPAAILWFLGIVGYQTIYWLRIGEWKVVSFAVTFDYFGIDLSHIYYPQSWIGVARIAQWVLSLPLSLVGALLIIFSVNTVRTILRGDI